MNQERTQLNSATMPKLHKYSRVLNHNATLISHSFSQSALANFLELVSLSPKKSLFKGSLLLQFFLF